MKIAIVSSSKDPAGINIRNNLIENFHFKKTSELLDNGIFELKIGNKIVKSYLVNSEIVHCENIDEKIEADFFIFASKHRSKENTPSFAVHSIGNWSIANLGGKEKELVPTLPEFIKNFFIELNKNPIGGYELTMEATHHGPYLQKPSVFVEIGSTEKEWANKENGKIMAELIVHSIKNENKTYKIAVGVGGPHYCNNFNKILLNSNIAFSFVCPKFMLEHLDEEMIEKCVEKSKNLDLFVLDWKGIGSEKQRIISTLEKLNLKYARSDKI